MNKTDTLPTFSIFQDSLQDDQNSGASYSSEIFNHKPISTTYKELSEIIPEEQVQHAKSRHTEQVCKTQGSATALAALEDLKTRLIHGKVLRNRFNADPSDSILKEPSMRMQMRKDIDRPALSNITHLFTKERKPKVSTFHIFCSLLSGTFSGQKGVKGRGTNRWDNPCSSQCI